MRIKLRTPPTKKEVVAKEENEPPCHENLTGDLDDDAI